MKRLLLYILFIMFSVSLYSQELNASLSINSSSIQGVSAETFKALENSLISFLNERKWSGASFGKSERIDCTFILTITEASDNSYGGELQITSRRPVYNSQYVTTLFTFKDSEVLFDYVDGEALEFNESNITSNLVAVFSFYAYVIIGLDFDSFAMNGGKSYFETAMNIANAGQLMNTKGWAPFESDKNRYALALALTEESSARFHSMWYNYHRLGLDEMAGNIVRGKDKIMATVDDLQAIYSSRPNSPLLLFYGDAKLPELVSVFSESSKDEKKEAYDKLRKIYPTKTTILEPLKK